MSSITVHDVKVLHNPAPFTSEFSFEVTFECHAPGVRDDLEWKLLYVGNAYDEKADQELDNILVGPVKIGKNKFVFSAPPPDAAKIAQADLMELTVVMLCGFYRDAEFVRVGYYVNNDYEENSPWKIEYEAAKEAENERLRRKALAAEEGKPFDEPKIPLPLIQIQHLYRTIAADNPRVTRNSIKWDEDAPAEFVMSVEDEKKAQEESMAIEQETEIDEVKEEAASSSSSLSAAAASAKDKSDDVDEKDIGDGLSSAAAEEQEGESAEDDEESGEAATEDAMDETAGDDEVDQEDDDDDEEEEDDEEGAAMEEEDIAISDSEAASEKSQPPQPVSS